MERSKKMKKSCVLCSHFYEDKIDDVADNYLVLA